MYFSKGEMDQCPLQKVRITGFNVETTAVGIMGTTTSNSPMTSIFSSDSI